MSWCQNQNDRKPRNNYFVKIEHHYLGLHCNLYIYTAISNDDLKLKSIQLPKGAKI